MWVAVTRLRSNERRLPRDELGAPVVGYLHVWWVDRPANNGKRCVAVVTTDFDGIYDRVLELDEAQLRRWGPKGWVLRGMEPSRLRGVPDRKQAWWCRPAFPESKPGEVRTITLDDARWEILKQLGRGWLERQLDALHSSPRT